MPDVIEIYKGKVAIVTEWDTDWQKPIRRRFHYVSPLHAEGYMEAWVGQRVYWNGNTATLTTGYLRSLSFPTDAEGYERIMEEEPIKAPGRGGKDWRWDWQYGKWVKRYR